MNRGSKIVFASSMVALSLLVVSAILHISHNTLPPEFNSANLLLIFSFLILGFMLGAVILLPKSAFKENEIKR